MTAPIKFIDIDRYGIDINKVYNEDCLIGMSKIQDKSIDMILCDLPYGTTQNKWDSIISLEDFIEIDINEKITTLNQNDYFLYCYKNNINLKDAQAAWNKEKKLGLWSHYQRIIKDNGAIILTASQPFTSHLIESNKKMFKYSLTWDKKNTTGFLNAKRMPLRRHEDICVFYKNLPTYNPIMEERGKPRQKGGKNRTNRGCYGDYSDTNTYNNLYYPTSIIEISNADKKNIIHPTQKPLELFKYLIQTYSCEGDIILDNCMGSGTTAIASIETNRRYIGFENDKNYFDALQKRISTINQ